MENNNSASRVRWILLNALHENDSIPTIEAWANVLIPDHDAEFDQYEVLDLLKSLREEINFVTVELKKKGVPDSKYEPHIRNALNATQANNISAGWGSCKKFITGEVLVCLSFSDFIIGDDEFKFDEEELEKIEGLIKELKESLGNTEIDPLLKHFVESQIKMLIHSLAEYQIKGCKSLKVTYMEGLGQVIENEDVIRSNFDNPVILKLRNVWEEFKSATEKAAVANKTIETWSKVLGKGAEVIEYLSKLT